MIRVVVADDEFFARKVLVKMLGQLSDELVIAGEAETGLGVLEIMEKEQVDIVITDIRMPDMDGLALAKEVRGRFPDTCVIIESGYADFEYATTAIRYGVKDYLTKPVKTEELDKAIRRVQAEKRKERQQIERKIEERKIQYMDFARLLESGELGERVLGEAYREMEKGSWMMAVSQNSEKQLGEEKITEVLDILGRGSDRNSTGLKVYYFYPKEEFILVFSVPNGDVGAAEKELKRRFIQCGAKAGVNLHAGLSLIHEPMERVEKEAAAAYREAVYAINQRLLQPGKQVYRYEAEVNVVQLFSQSEERELERCLTENRTEDAVAIGSSFFKHCAENCEVGIYSLFTSLIKIINVVNRVYGMRREVDGSEAADKGSYLLFSFKTDLYAFRSLEELKEYTLQLLRDVSDEESQKSSIIDDLLRYLERNYQYNITVNELAAHKYFVNPSYLSRLFKAETGKTFSRYLIELRMKKAAGLLSESGLKISDVAMCVGYNDVSYFIQTFKKYYEMTPEQYKNKLSGE